MIDFYSVGSSAHAYVFFKSEGNLSAGIRITVWDVEWCFDKTVNHLFLWMVVATGVFQIHGERFYRFVHKQETLVFLLECLARFLALIGFWKKPFSVIKTILQFIKPFIVYVFVWMRFIYILCFCLFLGKLLQGDYDWADGKCWEKSLPLSRLLFI